jgi:hypothetical protein
MKTNRRNFIKTTGIGSLGFGFLPALNVFDTAFGDLFSSANLSRKSPEPARQISIKTQATTQAGAKRWKKALTK